MPEVSVASIDPRHQKLIENARVALDRGNLDYVLEVTAQVLKVQPGCLPVRRLQRVAQLRQQRGKGGGFMGKALSGWSRAPFMFGGKKEPSKQCWKRPRPRSPSDPNNVSALKPARRGRGRPEPARRPPRSRYEAIREIEPGNREQPARSGRGAGSMPARPPRR
jgi:hypothetical protein